MLSNNYHNLQSVDKKSVQKTASWKRKILPITITLAIISGFTTVIGMISSSKSHADPKPTQPTSNPPEPDMPVLPFVNALNIATSSTVIATQLTKEWFTDLSDLTQDVCGGIKEYIDSCGPSHLESSDTTTIVPKSAIDPETPTTRPINKLKESIANNQHSFKYANKQVDHNLDVKDEATSTFGQSNNKNELW